MEGRHHQHISADDAFCAVNVTCAQLMRKYHNNRGDKPGTWHDRPMKQRFADGIHGLMCEIAVSRYKNEAWTPGGREVSRGDVGRKYEVRGTEYPNGHLLIYVDDNPDAEVYLVVGDYPNFMIFDPILIKQARQDRYWNKDANPPCWWVKQEDVLRMAKERTTPDWPWNHPAPGDLGSVPL